VLIVFSLHRESLKLILVDEPLREVALAMMQWYSGGHRAMGLALRAASRLEDALEPTHDRGGS
jgi:hypothetical protein